ncbi:uncharacterized protein AMSG_10651 [Thecamonas trahens ATCC 50062]|uniref:Uncharacterized protein n=1 Tax=Thecamonas trahens ATCC 50062 TaxID=461836 RepID=A0A0L0DRY0_THETB|nr:hypothetical protein AMSG_10651 [Thecamonas trahens ATCC 50062]KNC55055.1 hypothetical protein AMSG_10651 [Thecamonas trahens ATCC 50062]|eukprot:XP_013753359.1 hypothetical protein AMSG_10651 [Thecamonas trahens ATCC 50062]
MLSTVQEMMRVGPPQTMSNLAGTAAPSQGSDSYRRPVAHAAAVAGASPLLNATIGAGMVIAEMVTGGLFLENLKMEKQRTSNPYPVLVRQLLKGNIADKIIGFEAGLLPWGVVLGVTKGAVLLFAKTFYNNVFDNVSFLSKDQGELVAGALAGATQGVFISPLLLARTRVNKALVSRPPMGPMEEIKFSFRVMNEDVRAKGFIRGAIMPGMAACVAKRTLDWGSRFALILYLKKFFAKEDGTPFTHAESGMITFLGGVLSVSVTMPVDRLLPVIQGATSSSESVMTVMRARMAQEGLTTWFRGWFVRALHTGYHSLFAISGTAFVASMIMRNRGGGDDDDDE